MVEIARVTLQNEMDLILANRRAMKLAELAGLSLGAQTTLATAVSELSRTSIERGKTSCLTLGVADEFKKDKYIVAEIKDDTKTFNTDEGFEYAKRLADKYSVSHTDTESTIELLFYIPASHKLSLNVVKEWKGHFSNEPPVSPYEEIKRKNEQLQVVASQLLESENQYKTLTNSLPIIIFSLDADKNLSYTNEWFLSFTGKTANELNNKKWRQVVHPDDYDDFAVLLDKEMYAEAAVIKTQVRLKQASTGEYLWHLVSLSPVKRANESSLYWIGFLVDINAQKIIEKTLQQNKDLEEAQALLKKNEADMQLNISQLNRSNTELSQFAYVASHDLQEPLRKIILYSDYLLTRYGTTVDVKGSGYLKNMMEASHRMKSLIEDLLSFSMVNNKTLKIKPVALNDLVNEIIVDFEVMISEKKARFSVEPLPVIEGDANLLRQLFINIISNALKYSREQIPAEVSITCREQDGMVVMSFKDNGIGFDEQFHEKIFTLFQRLHNRGAYEGTGLGLAICKKIVELHYGNINAQSKIGEGSTFIVTLPKTYAG